MSIIHKHTLKDLGETKIELPVNAKFLSTQAQNNKITIWFEIPDINCGKEVVTFLAVMTGQTFVSMGLNYLGTVQLDKGSYVVHIYRKG